MTQLLLPAWTSREPLVDIIHCLDAFKLLRALPPKSVNCVVTSPPYWNLRDYHVVGQMGNEPTPQAYVEIIVSLFREIRRVLRDDGTIWLNLGDAYANDTKAGGKTSGKHAKGLHGSRAIGRNRRNTGLPPKSMTLIPFRVAIALQDDGWVLRSDIIWDKPSVMPESVRDRPTKAHEYIFLITKQPHYWYDAEAIREPQTGNTHSRGKGTQQKPYDTRIKNRSNASFNQSMTAYTEVPGGRNKRTIWTVQPEPLPFEHYAAFPCALIEPMIRAGCPDKVCSRCGSPWRRIIERDAYPAGTGAMGKKNAKWNKEDSQSSGHRVLQNISALRAQGRPHDNPFPERKTIGWKATCCCNAETKPGLVLDPFMGSGTTALVARRNDRNYIGSELNPDYIKIAKERLRLPFEQHHVIKPEASLEDLPLFAVPRKVAL